MKVVILAGGLGTRISEESHLKPKPMVEVGGKPILWHIIKTYQAQGFNEFIICLGYKGYMIKEYFANYFLHNSDVTLDLAKNNVEIHDSRVEDLRITLVETGLHTKTAGRLQKIRKYIGDEDFMLTYGDGLADINLNELLQHHNKAGKTVTVTAVQPKSKFGVIEFDSEGHVKGFTEKPGDSNVWINGGFFVMKPAVFDYLEGDMDEVMWEDEPMKKLARQNDLAAYQHRGFWKCMDILRDKVELEELWSKNPPWKIW
jgi:glucose-1-phosphate cytidylyltransferase